jgi:prepilin-type N-terminal cleavage/methylation domain-containing protein
MIRPEARQTMRIISLRRSRGFTLLELLIAIVILAFALLGLAGLHVVSVQGNSRATQITEATTLAQNQLEQLMATPFATLVGLGATNSNVVGATGVTYTIQRNVIPDASGSRATVNVTVTWFEDTTHSVNVNSVISQF